MTQVPLLLLDIDGCLSPLLEDNNNPPPPYVRLLGNVSVHEKLPDWLQELREAFSLVWITTWGEEANVRFGPSLNLPKLPVLGPTTVGTKFATIRKEIRGEPFAWIDDQIPTAAKRWIKERNRAIPSIGVTTKKEEGIMREHVDLLLQFAQEAVRP